MSVIIVNKDNFNEIINNNKKVILDLYATWCNPCKALSPILEEISNNYPDIVFGKIDIDENPGLANFFGVESIPYVVKIEDKKYVDSFLGLRNSEFIERFVEK